MTKENDFNLDNFEAFPVRCWTDDNESCQPVLDFAPLPDDKGVLFINVNLNCADGTAFKGSVIGYKTFHAFSVFYEEREYTINLRSREAMDRGLKRLWVGLGREIENFFPVKFEGDLFYKTGEKVEGELQPRFWK